MKILLVNSPIRLKAKPNCIPYGLAQIAAILRGDGHEVTIYDVNALRPPREEEERALRSFQWDLAGISGLITTLDFQERTAKILRAANPSGFIIAGGGLATCVPALVMDKIPVDAVGIGEGEYIMKDLAAALSAGRPLDTVKGLWFRKGGAVIKNEPAPLIDDLDALPFPAWDLLPVEVYLENPIWGSGATNSSEMKEGVIINRSMNIISSRGCPHRCKFCYHLFGRSRYRFRSAKNVVEEIEMLIERYKTDFIGFVDDNFMVSKKRLFEFCDLVKERAVKINWGCHGRVNSASPEVLERMAQAGCVWIGYGIESGSQTILNNMNKDVTAEQAKKAVEMTRAAGIHPNTTFIFGYPGENMKTVEETIRFCRDLGIQKGFFFITPYPGTPLYDEVKDKIGDEETFIRRLGDATEFTINLSTFTDADLFALKKITEQADLEAFLEYKDKCSHGDTEAQRG